MLMPCGRGLEGWPCVLSHLGLLWQAAPPCLVWWLGALPAAPAAEVKAASVTCTQGCRRKGRRGAVGRTFTTRGCQGCRAMLSCLSKHGYIDLQHAAWLMCCCWRF